MLDSGRLQELKAHKKQKRNEQKLIQKQKVYEQWLCFKTTREVKTNN